MHAIEMFERFTIARLGASYVGGCFVVVPSFALGDCHSNR